MTKFPGFPAEAIAFLHDLKKNNRREWFQPRKHIYEETLKAPLTELVLALGEEIRSFAPDLLCEPRKSIYRIYRDTRFSKDKSPYKTWVAAVFPHRALDKHAGAGLYFHISTDGIFAGRGIYAPGSQELLAVRRHIAEHDADLRAILNDRAFRRYFGEMTGEKLKRVPKGFPADHPAADLLVYKQFLAGANLPIETATTRKLQPELLKRFKAAAPFLEFLNTPLKPARAAKAVV